MTSGPGALTTLGGSGGRPVNLADPAERERYEARLRALVAAEARRAEQRRRVRTLWTRVGFAGGFLLLWELLSGPVIDPFFFSRPTEIARQLYLLAAGGRLLYHLVYTVQEAVYGYLAGVAGGIVFGFLCGRYDVLYRMVEPFVVAFYGIPRIALAPLFILWFGLGILAKIVIAAVLVFFVVFMNTVSGIRTVDPELLEVVSVMGASERQKMVKIIFPAATPFIITSLRVSIPLAMIGAIVGEFISTNRGIGYLLTEAAGAFHTGMLFAAIFVLLAVVMVMNFSVSYLEARLTRWRPQGGTDVVVQ